MNILYTLMRQTDTHAGNQIIAKNNGRYYLALIDNAQVGSLKFHKSVHIKSCSHSTYEGLKKINTKKLEEVWSDLMPLDEERCRKLIALTLRQRSLLIKAVENNGLV